MYNKDDSYAHFAVIHYDDNYEEFVYTTRRWKLWSNNVTSYICQLPQHGRLKYRPANYPVYSYYYLHMPRGKLKKYTCYRVLGPELIPVYRQSARR